MPVNWRVLDETRCDGAMQSSRVLLPRRHTHGGLSEKGIYAIRLAIPILILMQDGHIETSQGVCTPGPPSKWRKRT